MSQLFDSRAKVLECVARQALIEKEIELEKLKQQRKPWVGLSNDRLLELSIQYKGMQLLVKVMEELRELNNE